MAHVLMVTWDGGGNTPPLLGIARELGRRGHDLTILGHEPQRAVAEGIGAAFFPYREGKPWSRTGPHEPVDFFEVFVDGGAGRDAEDVLEQTAADAVLCDCLMLGPLQAAERAGRATLALVHSFWAFFGEQFPHSPVAEMRAAEGRTPRELWDAATEVLVATDRELDPVGQPVPDNVCWSGVVQDQVAPASRADRSHVLLSLSTVWFPGQQERMQRILDAVADLPVRVTATIDRSVRTEELRVPANVEVRGFAPHVELMPEVSIVIGHGGHATTMLALAHGLPLLVIPQFPIDQPMLGQVVAERGAGQVLDSEATVEQIQGALAALLDDDSYARAAGAIGERLRSTNGAANAADRIEVAVSATVSA